MRYTYNPPPDWPKPPDSWQPVPGWEPDPRWGPPPPGWKVWLPANPWGMAFGRSFAAAGIIGIPLYVLAYLERLAGLPSEAVMGGIMLAVGCVAVLARISSFRWPFLLYLPVFLLTVLFTSEIALGQSTAP